MRTLHSVLLVSLLSGALLAQTRGLTAPPSGNNQKASVIQFIGPVKITIDYSSPAVKDRRGQIWGKLVPYGMSDLGLLGGKLSPWRGGANENTVFTVSEPVMIEGQMLPAGKYGLHFIADPDQWTIIFSKDAEAWGSFFYDETHDALRVKVKPAKHEYREWLTYEFTNRRPAEATAELQWEELALPWHIKVDNVDEIYISRMREELKSSLGFDPRYYDTAAQFCVGENTHLEDALNWANQAISMPFVGTTNFATLSTKALVLAKMGRDPEAAGVMQTAIHLPGTTALEIHTYGRQLLTAGKKQEALGVFKLNAERNGEVWPVTVGLARGYMAVGDYPKALEYARKAVAQAPDNLNKQNLEAMVKSLADGKPFDN